MITVETLRKIAGGKPDQANMESVIKGLDTFGAAAGLDKPHRLAHFIAQVAHESGRFKYDREVWGPTAAQRRYEGRADLGNTEPGDGERFMGRTPMMITGRGNYRRFNDWCRKHIGPHVPDFTVDPDLVNEDPWEGAAPIWYWDAGTPTSLNVFADDNNIEAVTRKINGGLNGFSDRTLLYTRASLVMIGYTLAKGVVARFQRDVGFAESEQDDIAGAKTRQAMHDVLRHMSPAPKEPEAPIAIDPKVVKLRSLVREMDKLLATMGDDHGAAVVG